MKLPHTPVILVAPLGLFACVSAATFPMIERNAATATLAGASCSQVGKLRNTDANRSDSVAQNAEGLRAHPITLCSGNTEIGTAIFWSGTNAEANRLVTKPTDLSGKEYKVVGSDWNRSTKINTVSFAFGDHVCTVTKPNGGISPFKVAGCVVDTTDQITTATFAGKTVVYEGNGARQIWNADGTSSYNGQPYTWEIKNNQYCSRGQDRTYLCWDVKIINGGTQVVFEPNAADPTRYVGTFVN